MKYIKQVLGGDLRQYTMVVALGLLILIFNVISDGRMLTSSNFQNLLSGNAYVLVLALGMLMVIVIGQIDLSVGSVAGFAGMVMALVAKNYNVPWWVAVLIALAIGILAGAWHGFFLSQLGIPGFITTLGGMMIFRGGVIWISRSISVPAPEELKWFGAGYLPEWGPTFTGMNNSTLLLGIIGIVCYAVAQIRKYNSSKNSAVGATPLWAVVTRIVLMTVLIGYFTYLFGSGRVGTSFPVPGLILLLLTIIYHIITQRTKFGRHVYAVGGNKAAAALSGVNVKRTYFLTMMNMSFLAAVAGILFVGRSTAAGPADGTSWEMDAIASVFIGGAAVSGGVGTILATIVGGMVMAVLNNGLMLMGVGADKTQVIKGFVLLAAVAFDVYNKKTGKSSIIGRILSK
ncbi:sugar ABC transporter permease [Pseudobutyrivibrio ruminis]|uniref:sugar ABC transporter permease n=1 Tax=Pseudobutyrivibrio ruminis TaxID=46206 RepID=UPI00040F3EE5|nr:sugar ABC transporter permease [Pseudobutyrivibrio ruminis]